MRIGHAARLLFLALAGLCPQMRAQTGLTFEAVSIKPTGPSENRVYLNFMPGGRFRASGLTAKGLIQTAFGVMAHQVSGGPAWITRDSYSIEAVPGDGAHGGSAPVLLPYLTQ